MGLAMVHGIVHEHNGHILVETEIGEGTTFRLLFPAVSAKVEADEIEESVLFASSLDENKGNIMVVDDDESVAMFVTELLTLAGYTATKMTNSIDALSEFQTDPQGYDLVVTDQTMQGITGIELAKKIHIIRPNIPVILCSGYSEMIDGYNAKTLGVERFLQKPFKPKVLLEAVGELLQVSEGE